MYLNGGMANEVSEVAEINLKDSIRTKVNYANYVKFE
jgi:hypothetical protein